MSRRYVSRASSRGGGGALLLPVGLGTAAVGYLAGSTPLFAVGAVTAAVLVLLPWMVLYSLLVLFSMLQNHALGPLSGVVVGGITLRPDELILASFVVCVYALSRPGSRRRWAGTEWMLVAYVLLQAVTSYLNSQFGSYNHPNRAVEPRIPGIFQYYSIAEDELTKIFAGKVDAQTGANNIAAAWEKLTDQIGRERQIGLYKASLGV